jgi:hypothetical protein
MHALSTLSINLGVLRACRISYNHIQMVNCRLRGERAVQVGGWFLKFIRDGGGSKRNDADKEYDNQIIIKTIGKAAIPYRAQ